MLTIKKGGQRKNAENVLESVNVLENVVKISRFSEISLIFLSNLYSNTAKIRGQYLKKLELSPGPPSLRPWSPYVDTRNHPLYVQYVYCTRIKYNTYILLNFYRTPGKFNTSVFVSLLWLQKEIAIRSFHSAKTLPHINYKLCPHNCRSLSLIYAKNNIWLRMKQNIDTRTWSSIHTNYLICIILYNKGPYEKGAEEEMGYRDSKTEKV